MQITVADVFPACVDAKYRTSPYTESIVLDGALDDPLVVW